jgi:hypothetical protein
LIAYAIMAFFAFLFVLVVYALFTQEEDSESTKFLEEQEMLDTKPDSADDWVI